MQIKNSTFLVTGGGSGLGAATIEMVVANGGNAVIADVNRAAGEALAAKLGKQTRFVECDVSREDHGKASVELALQRPEAASAPASAPGMAAASADGGGRLTMPTPGGPSFAPFVPRSKPKNGESDGL